MSEEKDFDPKSMELPPSREFDEAAALLAYAASERKPPARLKANLMASLRPKSAFSLPAPGWLLAAGALAALLIVPRFFKAAPRPEILSLRGDVRIDGRAVSVGDILGKGRVISVSPDGEAVVRIPGRAGFRLSRGAEAEIVRNDDAIEVRLTKGWILSAVKSGTPYTVATEHGAASALGTDFMVKAEGGWACVCICHGRLGLRGFSQTVIAAEHHYALAQPRFPAAEADAVGHSDAEIDSLRRQLRLDQPK
jgi:hypothetical protein